MKEKSFFYPHSPNFWYLTLQFAICNEPRGKKRVGTVIFQMDLRFREPKNCIWDYIINPLKLLLLTNPNNQWSETKTQKEWMIFTLA